MISTRTKAALAAAKARGKALGGPRIRQSDSQPVTISRAAQKAGAVANRMRAIDRAADLAPTITQIEVGGATTLKRPQAWMLPASQRLAGKANGSNPSAHPGRPRRSQGP
jgi:hypothetical protein